MSTMVKEQQPLQRVTSVVVGLGATGLSCARYLHGIGDRVVVIDSRAEPPQLAALGAALPDCEVHLGAFDEAVLAGAHRLVVSPGVSLDEPLVRRARERGVEVCGDIELFARAAAVPVLGVTGSNGKSTVTTMLAAMLEGSGRRVLAGGNLGVPALDLLARPAPEYYVLELSSFQLERTDSLVCAAAAVLNLSPDHIDRHRDLDGYAAAKERIYRDCGVAVYNRDDARVAAMVSACARRVGFGRDAPASGDYGLRDGWLAFGRTRLMPVSQIPVRGSHNAINALAALALGAAVGAEHEGMLAALRGYRGLPHRMRLVAERGGIAWIDDSKATNVGAAVAAVRSLEGPIVLIGGGDGKGADFTPLAGALRGRVRAAVLLGRDAERLAAALAGVCDVHRVSDLDAAVVVAAKVARPGDTVLLSPACSSLDMFADYAQRGEAFARAVEARVS